MTWVDKRGLPLVWGLSDRDINGYRSTRHESQADVLVVALEPMLDLLEKAWHATEYLSYEDTKAIEAFLEAHNRLPASGDER